MPQAHLHDAMTIEYESLGPDDAPAMLWIMGFTAQMTAWDDRFLARFVDEGFRVVRFDNRDCGLSTKLDGVVAPTDQVTAAVMMGETPPPVPYTLSDMAADAVGILDHLGIERAHVIGASMGGMIAQTVAIEHAHRTASLTSIMSMPGDVAYGTPTPEAMAALLAPPPPSRADYVESAANWAVWCSKKHFDLAEAKSRAGREYDRSFYPEGAHRQLAAIYASGDRSEKLRALEVPTLVIHGRDDTLITPSGGERTAELVPGARLVMVDDMGHDLPAPLWDLYVGEICAHARAATAAR